jgi:hypothetical protein
MVVDSTLDRMCSIRFKWCRIEEANRNKDGNDEFPHERRDGDYERLSWRKIKRQRAGALQDASARHGTCENHPPESMSVSISNKVTVQ